MIESPVVREWKEEARRQGKAEALVELLELRFTTIAPQIKATIEGCEDLTLLGTWFKQAVDASSLQEFREKSGI